MRGALLLGIAALAACGAGAPQGHDGATITDAKISGDFFLEPEEAYDAINGALVGASVTQTVATGLEPVDPQLVRALATTAADRLR